MLATEVHGERPRSFAGSEIVHPFGRDATYHYAGPRRLSLVRNPAISARDNNIRLQRPSIHQLPLPDTLPYAMWNE